MSNEFGFLIKLSKPIQEYSDDELSVLISDHEILEQEEDALATMIEDELKRRGSE